MDAEHDYRLPTEAEWETHVERERPRATVVRTIRGQSARFGDNSDWQPHPVGEKQPNAWGLYDMYGNVFEWCQDWYDNDHDGTSPSADPMGPSTGSLRGDGWNSAAGLCRSAFRYGLKPGYRDDGLGFRVALVPAE